MFLMLNGLCHSLMIVQRVTWIFLLKQKSEVSNIFPVFHVKNQFGVCIKRVRTDNARDYFNQVLSLYFEK